MESFKGVRFLWVAVIAMALFALPAVPASAMAMNHGMTAPMTHAPCCPDGESGQHAPSVPAPDHCCVSCPAAGFVMPLTALTTQRLPASSASIPTATGSPVPHALGPPPTPPPKP